MECDRLKKLIKNWYHQVQEETMAPARMITFMRHHVADCKVCLSDPFVRPEIDKITAIILPPEKTTPAASDDTQSDDDVDQKTDTDDNDTEENEIVDDDDDDLDDDDIDDDDDDID